MSAKNVKTVGFPDWLARDDYKAEFSFLSEDGEPKKNFSSSGKCIYSVKNKSAITKDGKQVTVVGKLLIKGDIAPKKKDEDLASGTVEVNKQKYNICSASRPRNPNGTVHHTALEVY